MLVSLWVAACERQPLMKQNMHQLGLAISFNLSLGPGGNMLLLVFVEGIVLHGHPFVQNAWPIQAIGR